MNLNIIQYAINCMISVNVIDVLQEHVFIDSLTQFHCFNCSCIALCNYVIFRIFDLSYVLYYRINSITFNRDFSEYDRKKKKKKKLRKKERKKEGLGGGVIYIIDLRPSPSPSLKINENRCQPL